MAETISREHTFEAAKVTKFSFVNGQIVSDTPERGERTQAYTASSMQKLADISHKEVAVDPTAAERAAAYTQKAIGLVTLEDKAPQVERSPAAPGFTMVDKPKM